MPNIPPWLATTVLLIFSNAFMTFAWYYHVQKKDTWPLWTAIGISWLIALPEYILQVPANRIGSGTGPGMMSLSQLKILQEGITLVVFTGFAVLVAKQIPTWRDGVAMLLIFAAVAVSMTGRKGDGAAAQPEPAPAEVRAP